MKLIVSGITVALVAIVNTNRALGEVQVDVWVQDTSD
jgi:hypothetical protein